MEWVSVDVLSLTYLQLSVDATDTGRSATFVGELDLSSAAQVDAALAALPDDVRVVFDLGALAFMDAAGLRGLLPTVQARQAAGAPVVLTHASRLVRRVLEITECDALFVDGSAVGAP